MNPVPPPADLDFDLNLDDFRPVPPGAILTIRARLFGFLVYFLTFNLLPLGFLSLRPLFASVTDRALKEQINALFYFLTVGVGFCLALGYVGVKQSPGLRIQEVWRSLLGRTERAYREIGLGIVSYVPTIFGVFFMLGNFDVALQSQVSPNRS